MNVFFFSTGNLKIVMPIRCLEDTGNCFILEKKSYIPIPITCVFSYTLLMFIQAKFSFSTVGIKNIPVRLIFLFLPFSIVKPSLSLILSVSSRKCAGVWIIWKQESYIVLQIQMLYLSMKIMSLSFSSL